VDTTPLQVRKGAKAFFSKSRTAGSVTTTGDDEEDTAVSGITASEEGGGKCEEGGEKEEEEGGGHGDGATAAEGAARVRAEVRWGAGVAAAATLAGAAGVGASGEVVKVKGGAAAEVAVTAVTTGRAPNGIEEVPKVAA